MAAADKALDTAGLQRLWSHIQAGFGNLQEQINNLEVTGDYVPLTRTINGKALSSDISLTADDVIAVSKTTTVIGGANYGTELPPTGVEGQIFFKLVT